MTPVSDTLSAAYSTCHQHTLCFTPLCVLSLCSCYVLSRLLFSLRVVSLLFCFFSCSPAPCLLFLTMSTVLVPPPVFLLQLTLFCSYPPLHLTPYSSISFLFPVSWLDSIGVCALTPSGQSHHEGGGRDARVPFSIRTKHACGASRRQLEMQSGPLSWHPVRGRGVVRRTGAAVVWGDSKVNVIVLWRSQAASTGPFPPSNLDTSGKTSPSGRQWGGLILSTMPSSLSPSS